MVDPVTLSLVEMFGEPAARRLAEWAKGSEASQLVKLLRPRFPNAYKLLTQPPNKLAYRQPDRFDGGVLYVDMRSPDGRVLSAGDVAARLLRDLGIGPDAIPEDPERREALWRSTCATDLVLEA